MNTDEARERRIHTLFKNTCSGTSHTGAWSELPLEVRNTAKTPLFAGEVAVVFSMANEFSWCLLTSRRLIWLFEDVVRDLAYEKIAAVRMNRKEWASRRAKKLDWAEVYEFADRFELAARDGTQWIVPVQNGGGPLMGTMKALTTVIHDCERARTAQQQLTQP